MRRFDKLEGLGNDFVVVDGSGPNEVSAETARVWCDRRRGIGADGVLVLSPSTTSGADARMRVTNSDGSIAEMCGNGLRCAVLHLAVRRAIDRGELVIETDAGLRRCAIDRSGDVAVVTCEMGVVRVEGEVSVDVGGERVSLTRVNAGNPHAVTFRSIAPEDLPSLGPRIAAAPAFPEGTNVEFVQVLDGGLDVLVWERGAGATLACGTGACASVAAAAARGLLKSTTRTRVHLPGGTLEIGYDRETGQTTMRGPARRVFSGSLTAS